MSSYTDAKTLFSVENIYYEVFGDQHLWKRGGGDRILQLGFASYKPNGGGKVGSWQAQGEAFAFSSTRSDGDGGRSSVTVTGVQSHMDKAWATVGLRLDETHDPPRTWEQVRLRRSFCKAIFLLFSLLPPSFRSSVRNSVFPPQSTDTEYKATCCSLEWALGQNCILSPMWNGSCSLYFSVAQHKVSMLVRKMEPLYNCLYQ